MAKDYSSAETARMIKHVARLERALKSGVSPERLAVFERTMSAKNKLGRHKQVSWALMHNANEIAMNKLSSSDWNKFDDARRKKGVRAKVKKRLGIGK